MTTNGAYTASALTAESSCMGWAPLRKPDSSASRTTPGAVSSIICSAVSTLLTADNPVLVHRLACLLHASFSPRLATRPLRFTNPSPPSGWVGDFHPQAIDPARHNRDRGSSHLLAPPTPPYRRVRIRRFSKLSPCGPEVRVVVRHKSFATRQVSVSASPSSEPVKLSRS